MRLGGDKGFGGVIMVACYKVFLGGVVFHLFRFILGGFWVWVGGVVRSNVGVGCGGCPDAWWTVNGGLASGEA